MHVCLVWKLSWLIECVIEWDILVLSLKVCMCVCVCMCMCASELYHSGFYTSRSDTEIPHKLWFESIRWSHFILMNINHINNALSWIECNGFYLWKRWLYSFKVSLGIEAASNQLNKLTPADHQTYQGDVGPMSDYWEGFTKGLGYRHIWHLEKKTLQTCHCIVITYFCCDYVASYPRFPSAGVGLYETKPDLAVRLYITLVLTVFNNVHDCYLLL